MGENMYWLITIIICLLWILSGMTCGPCSSEAVENDDVRGRKLEIYGKEILADLEAQVQPSIAALLVIDVWNTEWFPKDVLFNINQIIVAAREAGVMVVFVENYWNPDLSNISPAMLSTSLRQPDGRIKAPDNPGMWKAHYNLGFLPDVRPEDSDTVVRKARPSAFAGTVLDQLLRSSGIKTVIALGSSTDACVNQTVTFAANMDYYVVCLKDCMLGGLRGSDLSAEEASKVLWGDWHYMVGWREVSDIRRRKTDETTGKQ